MSSRNWRRLKPGQTALQGELTHALELGRRKFLGTLGTVASSVLASTNWATAGESALETNRVRFDSAPILCLAPQYLAEEFLRMEGFTQIDYVDIGTQLGPEALVAGKIDFTMWDAASTIWAMDKSDEFLVLAGLHAGCWYLVAHQSIHSIRDLKGKRIAIRTKGDIDHAWISGALAYVGIDPSASIDWIVSSSYAESIRMFADGMVDACLVTPPRYQDLRSRQIGHVLVDSSQDRPWAQYYCCLLESSRTFVTRYPVATRRVMRALFKATDFCARDPERAAQFLLAKGFARSGDIALEVIKSLPFNRWRDADPEDTLRFYGLRFHDVGMVEAHPAKLIKRGTDWRFLNALRRELKS